MAWPKYCPVWWRHVLFFLQSYGVTGEVIRRRPWDIVWKTMVQHLVDVSRKKFWMGFFYLASGIRAAKIEYDPEVDAFYIEEGERSGEVED